VSESNGRAWWAVASALIAGGALLLGLGSGWNAAIKSDAAFRQRTETHLDASQNYGADIGDLKTAVAVNNEQILQLTKTVNDLAASQQRLGDKIDLLVQSQMRDGRIPR